MVVEHAGAALAEVVAAKGLGDAIERARLLAGVELAGGRKLELTEAGGDAGDAGEMAAVEGDTVGKDHRFETAWASIRLINHVLCFRLGICLGSNQDVQHPLKPARATSKIHYSFKGALF